VHGVFVLCLNRVAPMNEPESRSKPRAREKTAQHRRDCGSIGTGYWRVVAVGVAFTLARFSAAF